MKVTALTTSDYKLQSSITATATSIALKVAALATSDSKMQTSFQSALSMTATNIAMKVNALTTSDYKLQSSINMTATDISLIVSGGKTAGAVSNSSVKITSTGISLESTGTFTVHGDNFKIDDEGNVKMTGTITAIDGSDIAGWKLNNGWFWKQTETNMGTTVALSPGESPYNPDKAYVFWAGASWPERIPSVTNYRSGHAPVRITYEGSVMCRYLAFLEREYNSEGAWTGRYIKKWINLGALWSAYNGGLETDGPDQ